MYYVMSSDLGAEPNVSMEALNNVSARLKRGEFISDPKARRIFEPQFRFNMSVQRNEDGTRQEPRLCAYYFARELMHRELVAALQRAGVDNLQLFPAVITEDGRDTSISDYFVVNVVGLVSCAAVGASDALPFAGGFFFNELVIDPARTRGLLMFRLAESQLDLLVHDRVASELKKHDFPFLVLTPLREIQAPS